MGGSREKQTDRQTDGLNGELEEQSNKNSDRQQDSLQLASLFLLLFCDIKTVHVPPDFLPKFFYVSFISVFFPYHPAMRERRPRERLGQTIASVLEAGTNKYKCIWGLTKVAFLAKQLTYCWRTSVHGASAVFSTYHVWLAGPARVWVRVGVTKYEHKKWKLITLTINNMTRNRRDRISRAACCLCCMHESSPDRAFDNRQSTCYVLL